MHPSLARPVGRLLALAVAGLAIACGDAMSHRESKRLRVAYTSQPDVGDLPSLLALHDLEAAGYEVDATFYARPELAVEALASGDAEFGSGGSRAFWAASARGADLVMIMEHADKGYALVTVPDIQHCAQLTGRRLALSTPGAHPTALGRAYLQRCDGGARPRIVDMPASGDRLAALMAGAVDAAIVQRADLARLIAQAPGRFRVLTSFRDQFPDLRFDGVFVSRAFARDRRDIVIDYVRARLVAVERALDLPSLLVHEARQWPMMGRVDERDVEAEVSGGAWDRDGGLPPGSVAATYRFLVSTGSLPDSLDPEQMADRSFLAEALAARPVAPASAAGRTAR